MGINWPTEIEVECDDCGTTIEVSPTINVSVQTLQVEDSDIEAKGWFCIDDTLCPKCFRSRSEDEGDDTELEEEEDEC